jgi:hypothetical protein
MALKHCSLTGMSPSDTLCAGNVFFLSPFSGEETEAQEKFRQIVPSFLGS